jgi:hypothetical protein
MKTIVLQSFRTFDVPGWISRCMQTVRAWADGNGWDYAFKDDQFFALAPDGVRERCGTNLYAVTDVCRLIWIKRALAGGYDRVIWADADLLVFAPQILTIDSPTGAAFADEVFLRVEPNGGTSVVTGLNNALMVFEPEQDVLDSYLEACLQRLRSLPPGPVPRTALGPVLLDELDKRAPLDRIFGVGLFTLALMRDIAAGGAALIEQYRRVSPAPVAAANLCHFLRNGTPPADRHRFDRLYALAVARLLNDPPQALR